MQSLKNALIASTTGGRVMTDEFAEFGQFIDLPVKTYSTGMAARLAITISTAIEPDILSIDDGIGAVDAGFVSKVKLRLDNLIARTPILIFSSHDSNLVRRGRSKAVRLEKERAVNVGSIDEIFE